MDYYSAVAAGIPLPWVLVAGERRAVDSGEVGDAEKPLGRAFAAAPP